MQKKYFWIRKFLKHCWRTTGFDRLLQLKSFNKLIETFSSVKDAKTNELLIGPKTLKKAEAVRLAVATGYHIDPEDVSMFRELGRDSLGRMRYACYRGTNALEVCIFYICLYIIVILICSIMISKEFNSTVGLSSPHKRHTSKTSL